MAKPRKREFNEAVEEMLAEKEKRFNESAKPKAKAKKKAAKKSGFAAGVKRGKVEAAKVVAAEARKAKSTGMPGLATLLREMSSKLQQEGPKHELRWLDVTSYRQGDRGKGEPSTWEARIGDLESLKFGGVGGPAIRITVTRRIGLDGWHLMTQGSIQMGSGFPIPLGMDLEKSKRRALELVAKKLEDSIELWALVQEALGHGS